MKKVGIITVHNSSNYGGSLQSYALYKYISEKGNDCEIIDLYRPANSGYIYESKYKSYRNNPFEFKKIISKKAKLFIKKILRKKISDYQYASDEAKVKFEKFNSQIKLSRPYKKVSELYTTPPLYDVYITGSDQMWNPLQPFCLEPYFLTFAPSKAIKISYATSIAITKLTDEEKYDFKKWLASYTAISVREKQGKELLRSFMEKDIEIVADPTFLLDIEHWKNIAIYPNKNKPYILLFILGHDEELLNYAIDLSKQSGLHLIIFKSYFQTTQEGIYEVINNGGPLEFLGYIANADIVITDSFHGTVFSLIMGSKNFYSYISPNNLKGSRITDLLDLFNLNHHILQLSNPPSLTQVQADEVNHNIVQQIINQEQNKSRNFIDKFL